MPRTPKKITEQRLLSKEDFTWSQRMTVRDWNACKKYFDDLYNRLDEKEELLKKQGTDIIEMSKRIEIEKNHNRKVCLQCSEKLKKVNGESDRRMSRYHAVANDYKAMKRITIVGYLVAAIGWLAAIYYFFLCIGNGTI